MGGLVLAAIIGYFTGSIPFGLVLTRMAGLGDVRAIGSGNIGATNVLRTGNKTLAALTLFCDVLKGLLPVYGAATFFGPLAATLAGFAALAGHILPVWLRFKGGKGVATALGVLAAWSWPLALIGLAAWLGTFTTSRTSSLAALTSAVIATLFSFWVQPLEASDNIALWPRVLVVAGIIFVTHRTNIRRLLLGVEPRSSFSKSP